jgi:3-hydroxybutyryl-CoA dehydrogenase
MQIAIRSTHKQKEEILEKGFRESLSVRWLSENENFDGDGAEVYFDLCFDDLRPSSNTFLNGPVVFASGVNCTCDEVGHDNYVRINSWNGFINRPLVELTSKSDRYKNEAAVALDAMGWQYCWTPDTYGFVSARIIAMIINEAYFALEENVSTKEQIDIAMKLGTNYPYGPFEWSEKIGLRKVYALLERLSQQNSRYSICPLLADAAYSFKQ